MINERTHGHKTSGQRLLLIGALGVCTGVLFLFCIVYSFSVLQWGQQDSQKQVQAQQVTRASRAAQPIAAISHTSAVVTRVRVAAGTPLDLADFELRDIEGGVGDDALKSLNPLQGKMLNQSVEPDYLVSTNDLYDPAALLGRADIVHAELGPTVVTVGDMLIINVTVKNTSANTLKTTGPNPGFTYELGENYHLNSCAGRDDSAQICGMRPPYFATWRIAVGSTDPNNRNDFPYRWGLGKDLAPGESATVTGQIKINKYFEATHFWVALVREPDAVMSNGVGVTVVSSLPRPSLNAAGR